MRWLDRLRPDRDAEVDAEIDAHLRMAVQDRMKRGESEADARRAVLREFGNLRRIRDEARAVWRWTTVEQLMQDARTGARILRTAPGLSAAAVLLTALVIGGNTSIYSVAHGLLTKPAPGVVPNRLVAVGWNSDHGNAGPETSYALFRDLSVRLRSLDTVAFRTEQVTLVDREGAHALRGVAATHGYFDTLGIPMIRGRAFTAADDVVGGGGLVAIISHTAWHNRFGAADDVVGRAVTLNGHPATIVGVAAPSFQGVWLGEASAVWMPLEAYTRVHDGAAARGDRARRDTNIVGRLHPGIRFTEARAELAATFAALEPALRPENRTPVLYQYTGTAARNSVLAERGPWFLAIFSVVTLLTLVIVSANVANLMLARAVSRQREMAVRQSFGASRARILRLVLAEGLTLSLVAWTIACLLAYWMSQLLPRLIPESTNGGAALVLDVTPDWQVLGYAMLLAVAGTVFFCAAPAVRTWRQDLLPFLKSGEQGASRGGSTLSRALVAVQLAFSVVLLVGAGLGYRSLALIDNTALGFDDRGILLVTIDTTGRAFSGDENMRLLNAMADSLRREPAVAAAAFARNPPSGVWPQIDVRSDRGAAPVIAETNRMGSGFLAVHGLTLLAGRELMQSDARNDASPTVINSDLARRLFPDGDAVGRQVFIGDDRRPGVIVGVMPDALFGGFRRDSRPAFLFTSADRNAIPPGPGVTFYVRHTGADTLPLSAVTKAIGRVDPHVPVVYARPIQTELDEITWGYRTLATLLMLFAGASLAIAALGQYAAMNFAMRRRMRDFGIRLALGASSRRIVREEIAGGLRLTIAGLAAGLLLGLMTAQAARALLVGVSPTDLPTCLGVAAVLGATSMLACYLPARHAAGVDPVDVLRHD